MQVLIEIFGILNSIVVMNKSFLLSVCRSILSSKSFCVISFKVIKIKAFANTFAKFIIKIPTVNVINTTIKNPRQL